MNFNLIPLMVAMPLLAGFVLPLVPRRRERLADLLALLMGAVIVTLAVGTFLLPDAAYHVGARQAPIGINLVLDGASRLMLLVVAVITFAVILYSPPYMARFTSKNRFYSLFFLMVTGMNGVILTGDMFNLFVFLEIASIASYALVAFGCGRDELEASFRYLILGTLASYMLLLGIALLYAKMGTVNMAHLSEKIAAAGGLGGLAGGSASALLLLATVLFICGLGLKAALVPFHAWLPDAHPSAPTPISAMLSGLLIKVIGLYALVRVLFTVIGMTPALEMVLMILGTLSMVVGGFLAIGQMDFKRLLAYSSISQIGYVMLGIGIATPLGVAAGLFHLVNHAVFKSLLFLNAGAVEYRTGTRRLDEMGGLNKKMPTTGVTSFIGSMSISGVPPFNGFFSKLLIIIACFQAGHWGFAIAAVIISVLTLAYFMKVQKLAFFGTLRDKWRNVREVPATMVVSMALLAALCLATSVLVCNFEVKDKRLAPKPDSFLGRAQQSLMMSQDYRRLVLTPKVSETAKKQHEEK